MAWGEPGLCCAGPGQQEPFISGGAMQRLSTSPCLGASPQSNTLVTIEPRDLAERGRPDFRTAIPEQGTAVTGMNVSVSQKALQI